jgi:hypothetical protein
MCAPIWAAQPKSMSVHEWCAGRHRQLPGLMSRCTTPQLCSCMRRVAMSQRTFKMVGKPGSMRRAHSLRASPRSTTMKAGNGLPLDDMTVLSAFDTTSVMAGIIDRRVGEPYSALSRSNAARLVKNLCVQKASFARVPPEVTIYDSLEKSQVLP